MYTWKNKGLIWLDMAQFLICVGFCALPHRHTIERFLHMQVHLKFTFFYCLFRQRIFSSPFNFNDNKLRGKHGDTHNKTSNVNVGKRGKYQSNIVDKMPGDKTRFSVQQELSRLNWSPIRCEHAIVYHRTIESQECTVRI